MSEAVAVTLGDQVNLIFKGWPKGHAKTGQPLILQWNSRTIRLDPGQNAYVPFELAKVYFGDPRSVEGVIRIKDDFGNDMVVGDRTAEVIRLRQYWQNSDFGTNQAKFREYIPGDRSWVAENDGKISDMIPEVEVYALNGERIYTVVDDPFGDHVIVTAPTRHEQETMRTQMIEQSDVIMELKRQNRILMEKLGLDPEMLNLEAKTQDSALETPTNPVKSTPTKLTYNPRTKRVGPPRKPLPGTDPTKIEDLPPDTD